MYRDVIISMTEVFCRQQQQIQDLQNKYNEISDIRKKLDEEKRRLESVYNSAIFRLYRKIRYMVKKQNNIKRGDVIKVNIPLNIINGKAVNYFCL